MIGELRMQGQTAEQIADAVNAAGYRTNSKRFGARLFNVDTINAITRNEFYAAYEPGDERGTVLYKGERFRGLHPAATPRPAFLPVLRLLEGVVEYEEATGTLVTSRWRQRNRRASNYLQDDLRDRQTRTTDSQLSSEKWCPFSFELLEPITRVVNTRVFYGVFRLRDAGDPK